MPTSLATAELQAHDSGVLLLLDGTESSWIDLRDPAHLDFEYHQQMDAALSALHGPGGAVRAVHLGGAACALARAWDASRPGSTQLAVELDAVLAQRVRQWFELPRAPRLRIRVGDAAAEVPRLRAGEWDVVVRDVFAAGAVPGACLSRDFAAGCLRALAPGGLYLANTSSTPRRTAGADLEAARGVFGGVMVLADPAVARGKRRGNLVIVARSAPFDESAARAVDLAVRRLPLPVRAWAADDPALPRP
ncbi:MAG: fused MFS/spermidine synthase [Actinomyces sp.]|uniref:spermidine synthase n=1 Tax=Actinomyces sp. TaxID=29317 RepID=UPI0026DD2853|nr:fused MFS/spermidine synthase [Actinomyces sp.]MDO4244259.1 fused MFS/spermidine synthase [Actinomyces sp.]